MQRKIKDTQILQMQVQTWPLGFSSILWPFFPQIFFQIFPLPLCSVSMWSWAAQYKLWIPASVMCSLSRILGTSYKGFQTAHLRIYLPLKFCHSNLVRTSQPKTLVVILICICCDIDIQATLLLWPWLGIIHCVGMVYLKICLELKIKSWCSAPEVQP